MEKVTALADRMAQAASDLLDALHSGQRGVGSLPFADDEERRRWFYTPTPREGLRLGDLAPRQQQKVMQLMATGLSESGYNYASLLMGLENVVDRASDFPDRTYGNLPDTRLRDPANYFVAVFGTPGDESGWSWRIGGHHLSLHYTVRDGLVYPTPAFFGAEPAWSTLPGGVVLRPLAAEEDSARELLALLTPELDEMVRYSLTPKGLPARAMDPVQRDALVRLVQVYLDHLPQEIVDGYTSLLEPDSVQELVFAWAGSTELRAPHYYRVQSEDLLIEYDCTQSNANHTHSVLRNPRGDFGSDPLALHYAEAHHHE